MLTFLELLTISDTPVAWIQGRAAKIVGGPDGRYTIFKWNEEAKTWKIYVADVDESWACRHFSDLETIAAFTQKG